MKPSPSPCASLAVGVVLPIILVSWGVFSCVRGSEKPPIPAKSSDRPVDKPVVPIVQAGPWRYAGSSIYEGVTVYWRDSIQSEPWPWFSVIQPDVEDDDGRIYMRVRYVETGHEDMVDREQMMLSPAGIAGQIVVRSNDPCLPK